MKKRIFLAIMALIVLPTISFAASQTKPMSRADQDSLLIMKERVRIANELLKTVSGILGEPDDDSAELLAEPGHVSTPEFPSFRPNGLRQDSIGEFVWLPDSLLAEWNVFVSEKTGRPIHACDSLGLNRNSSVTVPVVLQRPEDQAFKSDYVVFRGDTIPRVLQDRKLGRFDRGLFNYLYIPKGIWSFGLTASYGELSTKDLELFDVLTGMTVKGHIFSISPSMQYFVKNNVAVGLRFSYTRGGAGVDSFNLEIDEDMAFNIKDIHYKTENYKAAATLRQYFGLDRGGRFGIFNEIELAFASGSSDFRRPYDGELRRLHSTSMQAALNFSPGLNIFIMKNVGFNVSFGVFGFSLTNEKQYLNDIYQGSRFKSGANFRFNIFNINFGLAVTI